jgi:hypothetical protein
MTLLNLLFEEMVAFIKIRRNDDIKNGRIQGKLLMGL